MIINMNGNLLDDNEKVLSINNRAFKYGDALFETMRVYNGKVLFVAQHIKRLMNGLQTLKMKPFANLTTDWLDKQILELLNKNNINNDSRIRLTVFRKNGGLYTPLDNSVEYSIEAKELNQNKFILNSKGLSVGIFTEFRKTVGAISKLKSTNCFHSIQAGIFAKENGFDECILLNNENFIAEAISSNIFVFRKDKILTPDLNSACVDGIMRKQIIEILNQLGINIQEAKITLDDIKTADEIFLTNAVKGIQWVESVGDSYYKNKTSKLLIAELNKLANSTWN